jgi:hypothetical protein
VYGILKKKTEILLWWENCANGKRKRELKKSSNENVNEIMWEWFFIFISKNRHMLGLMVHEYATNVAQKLGKTESRHLTDGWRVFAKDIK